MADKRRFPRIHVEVPVKLRVLGSKDAPAGSDVAPQKVLNLSCGGVCILSEQFFSATDVVEMQVQSANQLNFKAFAELVWTDESIEGGRRSGFSFLAIRDRDLEKIKDFQASSNPFQKAIPSMN